MKCPHCNGSGEVADSELLFGKNSDLPDWLPEDVWDAFVEMRKKIKKPLTEYGKKLAIKKLERMMNLERQSPIAVLEQAILRDDQGLYPVHGSVSNGKTLSMLDTEREREENYRRKQNGEQK
jgi:hypothetical protein